MAKSKFLQSSFVSGELSPLLKGRVDLDQYYQGMETAENVLIVPQGGLKRRAGTQHVDLAEKIIKPFISSEITASMPNGGTPADINDFDRATTTTTNVIGTGGTTSTPFILVNYDISGQSSLGKYVDVQDIQLTGNASCVLKIQASTNNSTWLLLKSITVTADTQSIRIRVSDNVNYKYFRIVRENDTGNIPHAVKLSEFNILYHTANASDVKTFDFSIEHDKHYLCVVTGGEETTPSYGNMALYRITDQTATYIPVANLPLPFRSSEVPHVRDVQTENVMLMFHEDHHPKRIINTGGDVFTIDDIPFLNVPQYDYNDANSPVPVTAEQTLVFHPSQELGDRFQIDVEGILSKNITYAGDTVQGKASTAENIRKNLQDMPIFGDTGITVTNTADKTYSIDIDGDSAGTYKQFTAFVTTGSDHPITITLNVAGKPRKEDVWSATYAADSPNAGQPSGRGFPKTAAFYAGRLWLGGTKSKLQSLFASRSGSFFDFYTEEGDDDEGIFTTISSRQLTEIIDINPDRGLQVFTAGAEFIVRGNTPSDITIEAQTQHGASFLEVKSVDGATLFVDQNGRTLRSYLYNYNEDAYNSTDISVLSSQLIDQPLDLAALTGSLSEDANWIFIVNQDGTSAILNTLRTQDINGFTKWINGDTNNFSFTISSGTPVLNNSYTVNGSTYKVTSISGSVIETTRTEGANAPPSSGTLSGTPNLVFSSSTYNALETVSVSVVNNDLFLVNKRTTDTTTYTIEKWDFDYLLDSAIKRTTPSSIINNNLYLTTPIGACHLDGQTVSVVARGNTLPKRVVQAGGFIILTDEEKTFILGSGDVIDVEVGYNFTPKIVGMPLNTAGPAGQNQMREKKITRMNLRVYKSSGVYIDDNPVPIRQFGDAANTPLDSNLPEQTGIIEDNNGGNGWGIDIQPVITVPSPTPFHIQAIEYEVESS